LAPRSEPVKVSKQDHYITTDKHINSTFYALNNNETQKNSSAELFEWFGPEFDDLLERWSEESSSSGRTGSESSSAADPYSPNSDMSDNGAPFEDVFYEQLLRFSASSTSSSNFVNRSCVQKDLAPHNGGQQANTSYGIEFFLPGYTENTGVLWTNKAT